MQDQPREFLEWLRDSEQAALELESALTHRDSSDASDSDSATRVLREAAARIAGNCRDCHQRYRDQPRTR